MTKTPGEREGEVVLLTAEMANASLVVGAVRPEAVGLIRALRALASGAVVCVPREPSEPSAAVQGEVEALERRFDKEAERLLPIGDYHDYEAVARDAIALARRLSNPAPTPPPPAGSRETK